uniref:ACAS_N domain-containing protein n=1 Tax=Caenorhabditis japonica TaxID=281687 RepID=A0A8R1EJT0_CAEJA
MTALSTNGKTTNGVEKHENGNHANGTKNETNGTALKPVYYTPPQNLDTFELTLRKHFEDKHNLKFANYREFHRFTCDNYGSFWEDLLKISDVKLHQQYNNVINHNLKINERPKWFNGATLNYTENVIERGVAADVAVLYASMLFLLEEVPTVKI